MQRMPAQSAEACRAYELVSALQQRFVEGLERMAIAQQNSQRFTPIEWFRDHGAHGGGLRYEATEGTLFGRGSVNVSQVHYDDNPKKRLGSANAISTIIHPCQPLAPSVHIHVSWTEMKSGEGYWRMMADLNPSNENPQHTAMFLQAMQQAAPAQYDEAIAQGDRYFYIPALQRHRGIAHFYLENYSTTAPESDYQLAKTVGEAAIDSYLKILAEALHDAPEPTEAERAAQQAYHTLYFFQVLTLDRGTTTGLLVHDQNDVGIMGSLPAYVDIELLRSWLPRMEKPQDQLLQALIAALPNHRNESLVAIDQAAKARLADVVRQHYHRFPEAITMQASGNVTPATIQNHSA